jgi:hypothetical protein
MTAKLNYFNRLDPSRNLKTVEQGAATSVWCATSPQLEGMGGVYCENGDIAPLGTISEASWKLGDSTQIVGVMPYAVDPEAAARLWTLSERMIFAHPGLSETTQGFNARRLGYRFVLD